MRGEGANVESATLRLCDSGYCVRGDVHVPEVVMNHFFWRASAVWEVRAGSWWSPRAPTPHAIHDHCHSPRDHNGIERTQGAPTQ